MKWWKKALIASLVLAALAAGGIFYMQGHIEKNAETPAHAEAWSDRLAELSGTVLGGGLVVIWFVFWKMAQRKPKE